MSLKQIWKNFNNRLIPAVILFSGAVFMLAGIYRGEMAVVLRKAINICLECIGIG